MASKVFTERIAAMTGHVTCADQSLFKDVLRSGKPVDSLVFCSGCGGIDLFSQGLMKYVIFY